MPDVPNDPIDPGDPFEAQLHRRVRAYADQAIQPIDAAEIARTTSAVVRRSGVRGAGLRPSRFPSLAWILVLGVLVIAVGGALVGGGGSGLFSPAITASPAPTAAVRACTPDEVDAVITAWSGAAGSRIATVELHQIGAAPCAVDPLPEPWLASGHGTPLITGKAEAGTPITIEPGDVLHTLVEVSNYCGPAPVAPVTVAFTQGDAVFVATALSRTDLSGVPPCNGPDGSAGSIQMQPFALGPQS